MPPKARKEDEIDPIELFKIKRLINYLRDAHGDGTSMVTILIPPGDAVHRMRQKLTEELGTASNIKNRVNRQSVESAITSAIQKLSHMLYPFSCQDLFKEKIILYPSWFLYPLLFAFNVAPNDRDGMAKFIVELLFLSHDIVTDLAQIHSFCEYSDSLFGSGPKEVGILIYLKLYKKMIDVSPQETTVFYQIVNYLSFALCFHVGNGPSNSNLEKECLEIDETKEKTENKLEINFDKAVSFIRFSKHDFEQYPIVFQIILENNHWKFSEYAPELIEIGSIFFYKPKNYVFQISC